LGEKINFYSISLEEVKRREEYSKIFCYPSPSKEEWEERLRELENLEVKEFIFEGKTKIGNFNILGKGCVSLTIKTLFKGKVCVLKIRRVDANRSNLMLEANYLSLANSVNVGPKLFLSSKNFIIMEYIDGINLPDWIKRVNSKKRLREVILNLLNQGYKLDSIGLDHGELSNPSKHVLVTDNLPFIIDFESASTKRRVKNVTSLTQYLFIGGPISKKLRKFFNFKEKELINALKIYKQNIKYENFLKILDSISVD